MMKFSQYAFALVVATSTATSFAQDILGFARNKTESREVLVVYDLPSYTQEATPIKDVVLKALTYQGDNAFVKTNLMTGERPRVPGRLTLKPIGLNLPVNINLPSCDGAEFTVSSSDNSMASYGDAARYMACGFPYSSGYRIAFYASVSSSSGGVIAGASKALGKLMAGAIGINSDPQAFVEKSLTKMEELLGQSGVSYQVVEMKPALSGKKLVEDPLTKQQVADSQKASDRAKRMLAREQLSKLGMDASDRNRLTRAIQSNDEDLVSLFVEAGAVDLRARDDMGRLLAETSSNASIKAMLTPR